MMRFVVFMFFLLSKSLAAQNNLTESDLTRFLDSLERSTFSGTLLVAQNDSILTKRSYGYANLEHGVRNTIDTKFNLASITKTFTAVAILQLAEKGRIDLEVPIGRYLPKYPNEIVKNSATIHHLLTHTSGLNNFLTEDDFLSSWKMQYLKVSDFSSLFNQAELLFQPGAGYNYSAAGYILLGLIIENASGDSYEDYIRDHIFLPARMGHSTALEIDSVMTDKANGYTSFFGKNKVLKRNDHYLVKTNPAGFHYSTITDLFRFFRALIKYELLGENTTRLMLTPHVKGFNTHLGYGIDIDQRYNQNIIGQTGGWFGVACEMMYFKDSEITVIILANVDTDSKSGMPVISDFFKRKLAGKPFDN